MPLLAVDIETTGLDPRVDRVLSIGWVPVDGGSVVLGGAGRVVVRDEVGGAGGAGVGSSATIHGLTDDALAGGEVMADAVARLLGALTGRVLLAHFARIETAFLSGACERLWGAPLPCVVVDTLDLEHRVVTGRGQRDPEPGALRLWSARERHGLPVYPAHEALVDALACAELYLAQRAELQAARPETTLTLRQVMA
ncbi:MAG: DNA polymerase III subunit epsilon [Dermatophilaceae bacterium]|nr:DNA polymerase III subunit epsilon [Dermatophilaceae bacterium]MBU9944266.1 DNA polymerase III subunit epsilon [Dermatophilaceae bacterium]